MTLLMLPSDAQIVRELDNIKTVIGDLSTNMNHRFDRVNQSLTTIFDTLNEQVEKIEIIEGRTAHLNDSVDHIRESLVAVQTSLDQIERNMATFAVDSWRYDLVEDMNRALGCEARVGSPMAYKDDDLSFEGMANVFYTHAYNRAASETLSHYTTLPFGSEFLFSQLSAGGSTNV